VNAAINFPRGDLNGSAFPLSAIRVGVRLHGDVTQRLFFNAIVTFSKLPLDVLLLFVVEFTDGIDLRIPACFAPVL